MRGVWDQALESLIQAELPKLKRLSRIEESYANPRNPLPTIGCELETPEQHISEHKRRVLDLFDIPHYPEPGSLHVNTELWEISPKPSYASQVQARILQELASTLSVPIRANASEKYDRGYPFRVPRGTTSLHVNFGYPHKLQSSPSDQQAIEIQTKQLLEILTCAYVSLERIENKKTFTTFAWKTNNVSSSQKMNSDEHSSETLTGKNFRFEIRVTEFCDYPTYRMLSDMQRVISIYFAYINATCLRTEPQDDFQAEFFDLYADCNDEITDIRNAYGFPVEFTIEEMRNIAHIISENPQLKTDARQLISRTARKVQRCIEQRLDLSLY